MEKQIHELETIIKIAISNSNLNVSVVELIMRNLYNEIKQLADQNLEDKLKEEQEERDNGNTDEKG